MRIHLKYSVRVFFAVVNLLLLAFGFVAGIKLLITGQIFFFVVTFATVSLYSALVQWVWYLWEKNVGYRDDGWDGDHPSRYPEPPFPIDRCSIPGKGK